MTVAPFFNPLNFTTMGKRKTVAEEVTKPAAASSKKATDKVANSSPASAKKAEKQPAQAEAQKPKLETRTVCFTDAKSGKKFCGEMTEVRQEKPATKVASSRKRNSVG